MSEKKVIATARPLDIRRQHRLREMLYQGCRTFGTRKDFPGMLHSLLRFLLPLPDHRLYIVKNMCMYRLHIVYCVEVVHELPLLLNNTAIKLFYTNRERCGLLTGYSLFWCWVAVTVRISDIGQNVLQYSFETGSSSSASYYLIAFFEEAFIRNII